MLRPSLLALLGAALVPALFARLELALQPVDGGPGFSETHAVDLVVFNLGAETAAFPAGEATGLRARLHGDGRAWEVLLEPLEAAPPALEAGSRASRRYTFTVPAEAGGELLLAVDLGDHRSTTLLSRPIAPDTTPSALAGTPREQAGPPPSPTRPGTLVPLVGNLQKGFYDRFAAHESVYIVGGNLKPSVKFQFSFKYRLATLYDAQPDELPTTLQVGYTQRTLWAVKDSSSPFYDSSYMPELFVEQLRSQRESSGGGFDWLGYQVGFRHESNGRDGDASRGLNKVLLRLAFKFGQPEGWNVVVAPELYAYVGSLDNNPRLEEFRNYASLRLFFNSPLGASLGTRVYSGNSFAKTSYELSLMLPIDLEFLDLGGFAMLQYFDGYGESLLDYDQHSRRLRAGISLLH
ncbi:MAG: phospholipase A [Opitutales bacterium]